MRLRGMIVAFALLVSSAGAAEDADAEIERKLTRKVTFEFVDTQLAEAVNFFSSLSTISLLVDPGLSSDTAVSLKLTDVTFKDALSQLAEKAGAEYLPVDGVLFFFKKGAYALKKPEPAKPLTDDETKLLRQAVSELSSEEFSTREAASKRIGGMGAGALPHLGALRKEARDPEVMARLAALTEQLTPRVTLFDEEPAVAKALDAFDRKVTFEFVDTPLNEGIAFLSSLAKTKIECDLEKPTLSLRVTDMKCGTALRWIARLTRSTLALSEGKVLVVKKEDAVEKKK
jgi:hypothetical protein